MSGPELTQPLLERCVEQAEALSRHPERPLGLHFPGPYNGSASLSVGGRRYVVRLVDSALAARIALGEPTDGARLVLVTSLDARALGLDVVARFDAARLDQVRPWRIVAGLFGATLHDPRLKSEELAQALLEAAPPQGFAPVTGDLLDRDTAFTSLLHHRCGFAAGVVDAASIVQWGVGGEAHRAWITLAPGVARPLADWLAERGGRAAELVCDALGGTAPDVTPALILLALLLEAARSDAPEGAERLALLAAHLVGPRGLSVERTAAIAEAVRTLDNGSMEAARTAADSLDELVSRLDDPSLLAWSDWSAKGFEERKTRLAASLDSDSLRAIWEGVQWLTAHRLARADGEPVVDRAEDLARLRGWLDSLDDDDADGAGLSALIGRYVQELSWVDRARAALSQAPPGGALGDATRRLLAKVGQAREGFNEAFARALGEWHRNPVPLTAALPIEDVVAQVVAPLATDHPVLLVVLDGMSQAVANALVASLPRREWLVSSAPDAIRSAVAMLPTITEASRCSLFAGRPQRGKQDQEKVFFAQHPALAALGSKPSVLLHKKDLADASGRTAEARVRDRSCRVVAAVLNAVDDTLKGADRLHIDWDVDRIGGLPGLLDAAREAGRIVVMTSDHGHIWHDATPFVGEAEGQRWKSNGPPVDGEVHFEGPRLTELGHHGVVLPWTERARYSQAPAAGYHGGATPQEVVVPIAVLWPAHMAEKMPGLLDRTPPEWWRPPPSAPAGELARLDGKGGSRPVPEPSQHELFAAAQLPVPAGLSMELERSAIWGQQKALLKKQVASDVARLLDLLAASDGRLPVERVGAALSKSPQRVSGLVATAQRAVNVDGYRVIWLDSGEDAVLLDLPLLREQFGLTDP